MRRANSAGRIIRRSCEPAAVAPSLRSRCSSSPPWPLPVIAVRLPLDGFLWYFDVTKVSFPNASFFHDAVTAGSLPLWVDQLGLGFPLYAEGQVGAFYPPNVILHLLPPHWAMEASRVLHLALAGVGAGLIALRLTGVERAMIVAAVATVLGGGIVAKLEWTNVVVAYGWLPWVLLPLVRRPAPTRIGLVAAGIAWGIQALAGHPNTWVMTGIAAGVLLLAIAPRPATIGRLVVLGLTAVAVGAVQLLPTLQLWSLSARTEGLPDWDLFSNSATIFDALIPGFANAFMPLGPREWDFATQWYPGGLWGVHESSAYLGLPMLGLAAIGLTQRRARPFAAIAVALIAIAVLGAFRPAPWLEMPILNGLRHPTRAYLFAAFALSVMAGIGVARLGRGDLPWRPAAIAIGGSMAPLRLRRQPRLMVAVRVRRAHRLGVRAHARGCRRHDHQRRQDAAPAPAARDRAGDRAGDPRPPGGPRRGAQPAACGAGRGVARGRRARRLLADDQPRPSRDRDLAGDHAVFAPFLS